MKRICFIINPISGSGNQSDLEELIRNTISIPYEICYTQGPNDATRLAKESNCEIIVAVGGDGTVNEVGKALIGTDKFLGIVPRGSGNGLARHCGIPLQAKNALQVIERQHAFKIDTGSINGKAFLNVAGIGFDGHIASQFAVRGKRGFFSYANLVVREFFRYQPRSYQIDSKDEKALLISFANSSQYGNNIRIAPNASLEDGLIDTVILRPISLWNVPKLAYFLLRERLDHHPFAKTNKGNKVVVQGANMEGHIDGEPVHFENEVRVKVHPKSLNLIVPSL